MSALRLTFKRAFVYLGDDPDPGNDDFHAEWRWTLTASNGRIVGASTELYRKRIDAVKNAALVLGLDFAFLRIIVARKISGSEPLGTVSRLAGPGVKVVVQP